MKRIIYLLTLLFCFAGCNKQEVNERMNIARISFINKSQIITSISYNDKTYIPSELIPCTYGDNKVEILNSLTGEKVIDTILNITGSDTFYIYQPFDIIAPVILTKLPDKDPIDPRNPLINETAAADGYMKIKVAFKHQFILPGQNVDLVVFSSTIESWDPVPIATLHGVTDTYNTVMFEVKRPLIEEDGFSEYFTFGVIDPVTGIPFNNGGGTPFNHGGISLPRGTNNLFMISIEDLQGSSRYPLVSFPLDGKNYVLSSTLVWSIK